MSIKTSPYTGIDLDQPPKFNDYIDIVEWEEVIVHTSFDLVEQKKVVVDCSLDLSKKKTKKVVILFNG